MRRFVVEDSGVPCGRLDSGALLFPFRLPKNLVGSFSVDLTTSTSMVIHRALQVVKSVAAFGFMDLSLDSSEFCQAQHNKLDVNAY
ncbi:Hypothetical protein CINCED_3A006033 [Cinara cedri]|uniref:Uncharacterized protein n=1 Tax=Cinara cedri TaxID=506608 RepID=A0A5E4MDP6_9HEMI|nr:Hypothetical protein CINCED_3A006033 [Cinara cedri]